MRLTLKDGKIIEGTSDELLRLLNSSHNLRTDVKFGKYGNKKFYLSESKGVVEIASMNEVHIRNAMCKIYREWVEGLNKLEPAEFLKQLQFGLTDDTFLAMAVQLAKFVYSK